MIKTPKNQKSANMAKLKLNHETLRVIGARELIGIVGGASGGVHSTICTNPQTSADIGCCTL